jgi:hypothetical protein
VTDRIDGARKEPRAGCDAVSLSRRSSFVLTILGVDTMPVEIR